MHVTLRKTAVEEFDITTTTVNVLFMFDCELNDKGFVLVAELGELCGEAIEPSILRGLDTCSYIGNA